MLSNCEKIVLLPSSTTNAWPLQPQDVDDIDEEETLFMASTNAPSSMEKHQQPQLQSSQQQQQQQQQQQPLRCPRCESSNTKFCYYNNYSLSQPRHFCKACKRYWTRGGTLRNVPVGGGCRKNKRSKRLASASDSGASSAANASLNTPPPPPPSVQASIEIGSRSSHLSTLFYGALPSNPSEINVSYPNLNPSYDLPPHLNALGLGFSSSGYENSYRNGFSTGNLSSIQDLLPPNSLLSSYNSILGCSSASSTATIPSMSSLIASSVDHQQKFINGAHQKDTRASPLGSFQQLSTFGELQAAVSKGGVGLGMKPVKLEDAHNRLDWNQTYGENPIDQAGLPDPSSSSWSMANNVGPWHDQGSIGSSVPSLI